MQICITIFPYNHYVLSCGPTKPNFQIICACFCFPKKKILFRVFHKIYTNLINKYLRDTKKQQTSPGVPAKICKENHSCYPTANNFRSCTKNSSKITLGISSGKFFEKILGSYFYNSSEKLLHNFFGIFLAYQMVYLRIASATHLRIDSSVPFYICFFFLYYCDSSIPFVSALENSSVIFYELLLQFLQKFR